MSFVVIIGGMGIGFSSLIHSNDDNNNNVDNNQSKEEEEDLHIYKARTSNIKTELGMLYEIKI